MPLKSLSGALLWGPRPTPEAWTRVPHPVISQSRASRCSDTCKSQEGVMFAWSAKLRLSGRAKTQLFVNNRIVASKRIQNMVAELPPDSRIAESHCTEVSHEETVRLYPCQRDNGEPGQILQNDLSGEQIVLDGAGASPALPGWFGLSCSSCARWHRQVGLLFVHEVCLADTRRSPVRVSSPARWLQMPVVPRVGKFQEHGLPPFATS